MRQTECEQIVHTRLAIDIGELCCAGNEMPLQFKYDQALRREFGRPVAEFRFTLAELD